MEPSHTSLKTLGQCDWVDMPGREDVVANDDVVVGRIGDGAQEQGSLLQEQLIDEESQGECDECLHLHILLSLIDREAAQAGGLDGDVVADFRGEAERRAAAADAQRTVVTKEASDKVGMGST
jgi:hypothetical protein